MTPDLELIKDLKLPDVRKGLDQTSCFAKDYNPYLLENGNASCLLACYAKKSDIKEDEYTHIYKGSTDKEEFSWLLRCEVVLDDPDPVAREKEKEEIRLRIEKKKEERIRKE